MTCIWREIINNQTSIDLITKTTTDWKEFSLSLPDAQKNENKSNTKEKNHDAIFWAHSVDKETIKLASRTKE